MAKYTGRSNRIKERERVRPASPQISELLALPHSAGQLPLDWFDPDFFNRLTVEMRATYGDNPLIALPPRDEWVFTNPPHQWKEMEDDQFMDAYGNEILKEYHMPTEVELENLVMEDEDFEAFKNWLDEGVNE
jgi:hypothetical protein